MNSCKGYCCAAFSLPMTRNELIRDKSQYGEDGEKIASMLIPLTVRQAKIRLKNAGMEESPHFDGKSSGHLFTCKNWDKNTKLCTDYANRPNMCSAFPYDATCPHGCGYKICKELIVVDKKEDPKN